MSRCNLVSLEDCVPISTKSDQMLCRRGLFDLPNLVSEVGEAGLVLWIDSISFRWHDEHSRLKFRSTKHDGLGDPRISF